MEVAWERSFAPAAGRFSGESRLTAVFWAPAPGGVGPEPFLGMNSRRHQYHQNLCFCILVNKFLFSNILRISKSDQSIIMAAPASRNLLFLLTGLNLSAVAGSTYLLREHHVYNLEEHEARMDELEGTLRGHIGIIEESLDRLEGKGTEADRGKKM